jgi:hypothetical protein
MASVLKTFCREYLGIEVEEGLFYRGSSGCTFGVRLTSGDRFVLKSSRPVGWPPFWKQSREFTTTSSPMVSVLRSNP